MTLRCHNPDCQAIIPARDNKLRFRGKPHCNRECAGKASAAAVAMHDKEVAERLAKHRERSAQGMLLESDAQLHDSNQRQWWHGDLPRSLQRHVGQWYRDRGESWSVGDLG